MSKETTMQSTATTTPRSRRGRGLGPLAALAICAAALLAAAAPAAAQVHLVSGTYWAPVFMPEGGTGKVAIQPANGGTTNASGAAPMTVEFPAPVTVLSVGPENVSGGPKGCTGIGTSTLTCADVPGGQAGIRTPAVEINVAIAPNSAGLYELTTTRSGGGQAGTSVERLRMRISDTDFGFGIDPDNLIAGAFQSSGDVLTRGPDYTQAGGHPHTAEGALRFNFKPELFLSSDNDGGTSCAVGLVNAPGGQVPPPPPSCYAEGRSVSDIVAKLPPGFVGDPSAMAQCTEAQFPNNCPPESEIGIIELFTPALLATGASPVFNMVPPPNRPAQFAFLVPFVGTHRVNPSVRADGDYGITLSVANVSEGAAVLFSNLIIWGTPPDPVHDVRRCVGDVQGQVGTPSAAVSLCTGVNSGNPVPSTHARESFLSMPTNCADPPRSSFQMGFYGNRPPLEDLDDPRWRKIATVTHASHTNCAAVPFNPTIDFTPDAKRADSPTGMHVNLHIPRDKDNDPEDLIQAHLKRATVKLPEGLAFNASAADGIEACSTDQIGLATAPGEVPYRFDNTEPSCPPASKVANAVITTPVLPNKLNGELFLAAQDDNPFDSTFAIYIVVREPSILVKLPGKVELDQATGQITTTFDENPQLPFSDLDLDFFAGPRAALATPPTCGTYTTRSQFTPWSAADPDNPTPGETVVNNDPFWVEEGPGGGPCFFKGSELPFAVGLSAGSSNPIAGAHSPFDIRITRPDGNQELESLEISPPPGFVASLKGIPYCSEAQIAATAARESGKAEQQSPTCPAASQIGTTNVGAGAGPTPLYTQGKLYLAGPYKGQTLSVVAVTPAVAGPFDLGNVVVRSALAIDPKTARITALSDPLPRTIEGVPLRIKDVRISLDRPDWAINPTNCEALSVDVAAHGANGGFSKPTEPYQVRECARLGFKPKLTIRLKGGTKRGAHPALHATLKTRPGDANIARAAVTLPRSAFLDQAHIRTICTRVQYAADACPKAATYGYAKAVTPLLDEPIQGEVILRSSDNKLPDLVGRLRGVANIEAVGRIDSVRGGIRNTFDIVPDAPFETFTLRMQGGNKGLVINSQDLCAKANRATVKLTAQNGRHYRYRPKLIATGCKKLKKAKRKGR